MKNLIIRLMGARLNLLALFSKSRATEAAFRLFCYPLRSPLNVKQQAFLASASERFSVETEDAQAYYYKWGQGPKKVLFVHGWQSHTYRWKAYIESLSPEEFSIYSVDAPGHGSSTGNFLSVPVYSAVIRQIIHDQGEFHAVVGHSLGGFSLLYTLHEYPLLPISRIVLMAPPGEATEFIDVFQKTLQLSPRLIDRLHDHFESLYQVRVDYFSTRRFAASLKVSGLIIHDRNDPDAPFHHAESLHEAWTRSTLIPTTGLGHNLKSTEIVDTVRMFIENENVNQNKRENANAHAH